MGLADWWYYTGTVTKVLVMAGIVAMMALALALIAPHVQLLKPIAQWFGLVRVEYVNRTVPIYINQAIYVNRTVYINQTVPVYVNRTVYVPVPVNSTSTLGTAFNALAGLAGVCDGRMVVLPNGTAWFVVVWLVPPEYLTGENPIMGLLYNGLAPNNATVYITHYNATTHYAQYLLIHGAWAFVSLSPSPWQASVTGQYWVCYLNNASISGYYVAVCGDVMGGGPISIWSNEVRVVNGSLVQYTTTPSPALAYGLNGSEYVYVMPRLNTTYTGVVFFPVPTETVPGYPYPVTPTVVPGPVCNITLTYAPNPTAALRLPITTNQTLIEYMRETGIQVFGYYNPYDWTVGYWVWDTPG